MAIAGMVCGIAGAVISITPCMWMIGIAPDIVGIVLSAIAFKSAKAGKTAGRGMAKAGLICGIVGVVLWFVSMNVLNDAVDEFNGAMDSAIEELE